MTLSELKTLKEKAQGLVDTFERDRQLLQETKKQVIADNSKDFQEFLDSLVEYAKLIDGIETRAETNFYYLFQNYGNRGFGSNATYVYSDDSYCGIRDNKIIIFNSGDNISTNILITKDKATFDWYKDTRFIDVYKVFILEHKAEIKACVERTVELALDNYVQSNKEKNDILCSEIASLKQDN